MLNKKYEALKNYLIDAGEATADELTEDVSAVYTILGKRLKLSARNTKYIPMKRQTKKPPTI